MKGVIGEYEGDTKKKPNGKKFDAGVIPERTNRKDYNQSVRHEGGEDIIDYNRSVNNGGSGSVPANGQSGQPIKKEGRKKLPKKIKRYESNSIDEEEFQDCK